MRKEYVFGERGRELSDKELECVVGGNGFNFGLGASTMGAGAAMVGMFVLVPGPHQPFAAGLAGIMGLTAAGLGLLAY